MIRRLPLAVLVTVVALSAASVAAASSTPSSVLVAVDPGIAAERLIAGQGGRLVSKALGIWKVGRKAASRVLPELSEQGFLRYSEPNFVRAPAALETVDPLAADAWQLARVGADRAQSPGPGVPMTIIDGGIVLSYPELAGRPNVVSLNAQPTAATKVTEHGTEIAAIAGAPMNGVGTVGIYPELTLASYTLAGFDDASIIAAHRRCHRKRPERREPVSRRARLLAVALRVDPASGERRIDRRGLSRELDDRAGSCLLSGEFPTRLHGWLDSQERQPSSFSIRAKTVDLAAPGEELSVLDPPNPSQRSTSGARASRRRLSRRRRHGSGQLDLPRRNPSDRILRRTAQDVGVEGVRRRHGLRDSAPSPSALAASAPGPIHRNRMTTLPSWLPAGCSMRQSRRCSALSRRAWTSPRIRGTSTDSSFPPGARPASHSDRSRTSVSTFGAPETTSVAVNGAKSRRYRLGSPTGKARLSKAHHLEEPVRLGQGRRSSKVWIPARRRESSDRATASRRQPTNAASVRPSPR